LIFHTHLNISNGAPEWRHSRDSRETLPINESAITLSFM